VELLRERTVKLPGMSAGTGSARFALVFEASNLPSRAEYLDDDARCREWATNCGVKPSP
jgi:hypothetical protein